MRKILARYKGKVCFPLEYLFPVDYMNDCDFIDMLKEDVDTSGDGWEVVKNISAGSAKAIPDKMKGLYFFMWSPQIDFETTQGVFNICNVVYVGSSTSIDNGIKNRFLADYEGLIGKHYDVHWIKKEAVGREDKLKKIMNLGCLNFFFNTMNDASKEQILDMEERLIKLLNPPGNIKHALLRGSLDKVNVKPAF